MGKVFNLFVISANGNAHALVCGKIAEDVGSLFGYKLACHVAVWNVSTILIWQTERRGREREETEREREKLEGIEGWNV